MTNEERVEACLDQLKVLDGVPPHNTISNYAWNDGYAREAWKRRWPKYIRDEAIRQLERELKRGNADL